jgi:superfamily II DNA or RNA helicase
MAFNTDKMKKFVKNIYETGDLGIANIVLKPEIEKKILSHQIVHLLNLINILNKSNTSSAVDFSNTGTGKTYTTIALCAQLNLQPIIICPKSVICYWNDICKIYNVKPRLIINYDSLRVCKELNNDMKKQQTDIIEFSEDEKTFKWKNIDKNNNILIFDEAHKCKNKGTLNGKMLFAAKNVCRILLLSATIAQKPEEFVIFGYILDFYKNITTGHKWIKTITKEELFKLSSKEDSQLVKYIYPNKGSKMPYAEMCKNMDKNNIVTQCYTIDDKSLKMLEKEYNNMRDDDITIVKLIQIRQNIEHLKIPIFIDLIEKYFECGKSVVVFVNYLKTVSSIVKHFTKKQIDCECIIGEQTLEERTDAINRFQNNTTKIIICIMGAGSESISLHDIDGNYPRVSLISPSYSSKDLCQALGRIYRSGTKSHVEQKIIFCDHDIERNMCEKLKDKIKFLNNFSDNDKLDLKFLEYVSLED